MDPMKYIPWYPHKILGLIAPYCTYSPQKYRRVVQTINGTGVASPNTVGRWVQSRALRDEEFRFLGKL